MKAISAMDQARKCKNLHFLAARRKSDFPDYRPAAAALCYPHTLVCVILPPRTVVTGQQITVGTILDQFRDDARNNRDLGDRFERFMQKFFRVDPLYASLFSDVWMWTDWPQKG